MIVLRALTIEDAPAFMRIYSGATVRFTTGKALTLEEARTMIHTALSRAAETPRAQWNWVILAKGEIIGLVALRRRSPVMGTISCALHEDSCGRGFGSEAMKQVIDFAFTALGLNRVEGMRHPDNTASGLALAKIGFVRTGTCDYTEDGKVVRYVTYAVEACGHESEATRSGGRDRRSSEVADGYVGVVDDGEVTHHARSGTVAAGAESGR
ncbi:GNAT family N-acetyltransferase [Streptomyces lavendulae]|uniref:GNAT family N-acetyltransferase n=1 Tax=Streptomyces lavendulae TaxID=1914 RepID=UPI003687787F